MAMILGALACFFGGVGASRWLAAAPPKAAEPQIMIDPRSIQLLPDASLRLAPVPSFDAGL